MLKIEVTNLKEVYELLGDMRDKVDALMPIAGNGDISREFFNWQAEDMRRRYPEVEEPDPHQVVARIYPRSRKERVREASVSRGRRKRRPLVRIRRVRGSSNRPILRPVLFEKLADRMARMMEERLTWR